MALGANLAAGCRSAWSSRRPSRAAREPAPAPAAAAPAAVSSPQSPPAAAAPSPLPPGPRPRPDAAARHPEPPVGAGAPRSPVARGHRRGPPEPVAALRPPPWQPLRGLLRAQPAPARRAAHVGARPRGRAAARLRPISPRAVPEDAWGRQHLSGKSSQTLAVGLLGVAARRDPSLGWLWERSPELPPAQSEAPAIEFEHVVSPELLGERPRQTSIDVLIDDPGVVVALETKWREHGSAPACAGATASGRAPASAARGESSSGPRTGTRPSPCSASACASPAAPVRSARCTRPSAMRRPRARSPARSDRRCWRSSTTRENPYFSADGDWPGLPALLEEAVTGCADAAGIRVRRRLLAGARAAAAARRRDPRRGRPTSTAWAEALRPPLG